MPSLSSSPRMCSVSQCGLLPGQAQDQMMELAVGVHDGCKENGEHEPPTYDGSARDASGGASNLFGLDFQTSRENELGQPFPDAPILDSGHQDVIAGSNDRITAVAAAMPEANRAQAQPVRPPARPGAARRPRGSLKHLK